MFIWHNSSYRLLYPNLPDSCIIFFIASIPIARLGRFHFSKVKITNTCQIPGGELQHMASLC